MKFDARPFIIGLSDKTKRCYVYYFPNSLSLQFFLIFNLFIKRFRVVYEVYQYLTSLLNIIIIIYPYYNGQIITQLYSINYIWQHYCKHPSHRTSVSTLSLDRPLECSSSNVTSLDEKHARKQRYPKRSHGPVLQVPIFSPA